MAIPCRLSLSPQSDWIVFSAPEITTVSKPNRNPASAEVSDQKKMRPFIGEAQVNTESGAMTVIGVRAQPKRGSVFRQGIALFAPAANSPVHRNDVGVAHFLQVVGSQGRAESTTAI